MKNLGGIMIVLMTAGLLSCSTRPPETPDKNFYVEINTYQNDSLTHALSAFLKNKIPQKKYTITNQSGKTWPYYAELALDQTIAKDSLMPPHWYIHKMIVKDSNTVLLRDDHLVRIDLMPVPDTIGNYRVEVYQMDSLGLTFLATSGIHFIDSAELSSTPSPFDYYLRSIIRYSFK